MLKLFERVARSPFLPAFLLALGPESLPAIEYTETFQATSRYRIDWCRDQETVRFRLAATSNGWLGIGFNELSQMPGSDVIMATGEGTIQDAFADRRGVPLVDSTQDVVLDSFAQENGITTVEFARPIVPQDSTQDKSLDSFVYLVWAMNTSSDSFQEHHTHRGATPVRVNFSEAATCGGMVVAGDLSGDGIVDVVDVDLLREAILMGMVNGPFDINQDALVDQQDLASFQQQYFGSYIGDANLDGEFSTTDLVHVFSFGEYEDLLADNTTWSEGDWNADADFDTADLVFAFQDGGFEAGPRQAFVAVPEPAAGYAVVAGFAWMAYRRRRLSDSSLSDR